MKKDRIFVRYVQLVLTAVTLAASSASADCESAFTAIPGSANCQTQTNTCDGTVVYSGTSCWNSGGVDEGATSSQINSQAGKVISDTEKFGGGGCTTTYSNGCQVNSSACGNYQGTWC